MAAKHAHKRQITEFKYGGSFKAFCRKILKIRQSNYLQACSKNALVGNGLKESQDHSSLLSNS